MSSVNNTAVDGGDLTAIQRMISSCSGAMLTSIFVTPLDVVKIRLQAQRKPEMFTSGHCFSFSNGLMEVTYPCYNGNTLSNDNCKHPEHQGRAQSYSIKNGSSAIQTQFFKKPGNFNGTLDAFIQITRNEGITSLWSGLPPTLVMAVPATVIYFTLYDQLRNYMQYSAHSFKDNWWKPVVAGGSARVIAATFISPLELIRTKMQSEKMTYRQVLKAAKITTGQDGALSLWRGLGPTLLRDVPFSSLYWLGYEVVKGMVVQQRQDEQLRFAESFVAGAVSGSIAALLTLPFDVIKTHRQIELGEKMFFKGEKQISSTWRLIQNLYQREGITVLFSGLTPRLIKVAPACAIMISTYEFCKAFFREKNIEQALPEAR